MLGYEGRALPSPSQATPSTGLSLSRSSSLGSDTGQTLASRSSVAVDIRVFVRTHNDPQTNKRELPFWRNH
jgi:hypothetical protein